MEAIYGPGTAMPIADAHRQHIASFKEITIAHAEQAGDMDIVFHGAFGQVFVNRNWLLKNFSLIDRKILQEIKRTSNGKSATSKFTEILAQIEILAATLNNIKNPEKNGVRLYDQNGQPLEIRPSLTPPSPNL